MKLIKKGAEADIYEGKDFILKVRVSKRYRIKELDEKLRKYRNRREIKILKKAKEIGINVPNVIEEDEFSFKMEKIEGKRLKDVLDEKNVELFAKKCGDVVGKLHKNNIIHGDLTTSNFIVREKDNKLYIIDFGLGFISTSIEDKATDIHVLEETTKATHPQLLNKFMEMFLDSYSRVYYEKWENIVKRLEKIRKRGRYVH